MRVDRYREDSKSIWFHFEPSLDEDMFPVRIISVGHIFSSKPGYCLNSEEMQKMNPFPYHSFQYQIAGNGIFRYKKGDSEFSCDIPPQHLFIMSHSLDYEFKFTEGKDWEWLWIVLAGDFPERVLSSTQERAFALALDSPLILHLKTLLQTVLHSPLTANEIIANGCDFVLKFKDVLTMSRLSAEENFLYRSKQFISKNIRTVNVEELARYHGFSTKYFQRHFLKISGTTPGEFIMTQKVNLATVFLQNSSKKLSDIAYMSGFSDDSHLCRVFKDRTGQSPNEWRLKRSQNVRSVQP